MTKYIIKYSPYYGKHNKNIDAQITTSSDLDLLNTWETIWRTCFGPNIPQPQLHTIL